MPNVPRRIGLAALFTIGLSACATTGPQLSRVEWLEIRNRHYADAPDRVFAAAEQLFQLSDGSDVKFSYPDEATMEAVRWTAPFPVHVWYHWDLRAMPAEQGADVTVSIWITAAGFGVPGGRSPHDSPDVIRLFYARLDYLLGTGSTWPTCDDYERQHPSATTLEALCLLAKDEVPTRPI